jgi:hypothetical protein
MGPGEFASDTDQRLAYELGARVAQQNWILLTGGRASGIMDAASRGAKQAHGLTIGILPSADARGVSDAIDIVIPTGLGNARNAVNILASQVIIACGMGSGTASEVALAIKSHKPVILLNVSPACQTFFQELSAPVSATVMIAQSPEEAIEQAKTILKLRDPLP